MNKNNYKDIKIKGKLLKNDVYWMMNKLKIIEHDEWIFNFFFTDALQNITFINCCRTTDIIYILIFNICF